MRRQVRILREADVRASLDMAGCIEACDAAFASYWSGRASTPSVISLEIPDRAATVHVKAGHVQGERYFAVKVAAGFPENVALGLPANGGMVIVFDATTGEPAAFLLDNGYITDLRTGAAGGVAARYLARQDVRTVAVIGTGAQARYQLDALAVVRPGFAHVRIWGRDADRAAACVDDLGTRGGLPGVCTGSGERCSHRRGRRRRRHHLHRVADATGSSRVAHAGCPRHRRRIRRRGQAGVRRLGARTRRSRGR